MEFSYPLGRILLGENQTVRQAHERFRAQPVDVAELCAGDAGYSPKRTTLGGERSVTGPGTFYGRAQRTLTFGPSAEPGWWIDRTDLAEQLKTRVTIRNVWTSARNIVLRSGNPHNYLRMVEHIIALRLGLGVDDVVISTNAGDPPLFDRSSLDLVEAVEQCGIVERDEPARYVTVKEPVTFGGDRGDFLTILPPENGEKKLRLDVAIDFHSIIGQQRIVFDVTPATFRTGAFARTNASHRQMLAVRAFGFLFADTRNLGYTTDNILIHGKRKFYGEPRLVQASSGKALEPVWHRAALDLLAAIALIDTGRFVGRVVSYRAGHTLDVRAVGLLYLHDLLTTV
ncbi:MAG: UDP-3-O-acyl-N-acetylglucosamine deacetylase [Verrucomicrobiota bacterium]|jgi:UDP-3-O-[3-hydroxymyristoyl] N-acetylglucosamine deacetylase|nr:UDP-3-O-acyl-N-acetylglucosamine deacetylase [Verrucomicrobiota bacterium]